MCKFLFGYKRKNRNFNFFKNIIFNFLFFSKLRTIKKFQRVNFNTININYNIALILYYNNTISNIFFEKLKTKFNLFDFSCYKNIFYFNFLICVNQDIIKFNNFVFNELVIFKNYFFPYILLYCNLLCVNEYYIFLKLPYSFFLINYYYIFIIFFKFFIIKYLNLIKYFFIFIFKNYLY